MRNGSVYRVHGLIREIAEQNARMRELMTQASEVLKQPIPDTFLGRKTQEPFPNELRKDGSAGG